MPAITAETTNANSFTFSTRYPMNRVRLSASRTATITLPSLELTMVEPVPEPGQFLVVQKHHEIGKDRIGVNAPIPDLAHQIHAHDIAAERKERGMTQRQDADITPHQIERQGEHSEGQVFAEQRDE